jgi:hypothetical protein
MMNRSGDAKKSTARGPRKSDDLLTIWLDLLKHIDKPAQRRAARLRRSQRPRRTIPIQRARLEGYGNQRDALRSSAGPHGTAP